MVKPQHEATISWKNLLQFKSVSCIQFKFNQLSAPDSKYQLVRREIGHFVTNDVFVIHFFYSIAEKIICFVLINILIIHLKLDYS